MDEGLGREAPARSRSRFLLLLVLRLLRILDLADCLVRRPFVARATCDGETGWAIPLAGFYDDRARHQATNDRLSFACQDEGVGAKCLYWGYPPGTDPNDAAVEYVFDGPGGEARLPNFVFSQETRRAACGRAVGVLLESIDGKRTHPCDAHFAARGVPVLVAAEQSIRTGTPVAVS